MITTLTINPALDLNLTVNELFVDDSNRVIAVQKDPGGKGINVSRILNKLGTKVTTITLLGGNTGNEVTELLRKEQLVPFTIPIKNETRTNVTITNLNNFSQTRFNQAGPELDRDEYASLLSLIEQLGDNANIFVMSGSLLPSIKPTAYQEIINKLKLINPKIKIILDADDEAMKHGISACPYMIKPNIHEAERILDRKLTSLADIKQALLDLYAKEIKLVIISRGKDGLVAYDGKKMLAIDPIPVEAKSTIGAGDSLIAGICYMLEKTEDLQEILTFAVKVSTAKVTTTGTSVIGWEEINAITAEPVIRVI